MIQRALYTRLKEALIRSNKVILLYGARQTGKTTLVSRIIKDLTFTSLTVNADEIRYHDVLSSRDLNKMKMLADGYELLFIDEAQRIDDIGINLKILHDNLPDLKIIVSGSSSLELANRTREPLTGRLESYALYPVAWLELLGHHSAFELRSRLEELMIYGSYPEIFSIPNARKKQQYLMELSSSYLYKDVLELTNIRHSRKLADLLRLLAFQIGSQVSLSELGASLQMSKETVASYIDLLEKSFILIRLRGFSRNLRKEITKMDKFYFSDLGIRNALINNFNSFRMRNDHGQLWENFLVNERIKYQSYAGLFSNNFFWRTYTGAKIDWIEERQGSLYAYEFKYGNKSIRFPSSWKENYPDSEYKTINLENYHDFIA